MAVFYTEFTCLGQDILANIKTAILKSTDWTQPNAGGYPSLFKCTTTRGADMILDFADVAPTVLVMQVGVYRTHDGTNNTGKVIRYLPMKKNNIGALGTNTYRGIVSVSKDHIYVQIEGPRPGESNADNASYGSIRSYIAMSDLVPYFDNTMDPTPTAILMAWSTNTTAASVANNNHNVWSSTNPANTAYWHAGKLATLTFPMTNIADSIGLNWSGLDGDTYLAPYVYFSDTTGIRGRLSSFFYAGFNVVSTYETPPNSAQQVVTYNGQKYKLLPVCKSDSTATMWGPFGATTTATAADSSRSVLVAVPYA